MQLTFAIKICYKYKLEKNKKLDLVLKEKSVNWGVFFHDKKISEMGSKFKIVFQHVYKQKYSVAPRDRHTTGLINGGKHIGPTSGPPMQRLPTCKV